MTLTERAAEVADLTPEQVKRAVSAYVATVIVASLKRPTVKTLIGKMKVRQGRLILVTNSKRVRRWMRENPKREDILNVMQHFVEALE